jgi:Holliday junction DNA helicase RuvA
VFQNQVDNPWIGKKGVSMIGRLTGVVGEKAPPQILMDCQGVGYEVWVPMSTFYHLPAIGERATLLTHFVVREDAQILFGFLSAGERDAFRQLIKISGVGPRTALGILSGLSVADLAKAIQDQDAQGLVKIPGIGKKTAERLLLELKGKLDTLFEPSLGRPDQSQSERGDVLQALVALGYSDKEATGALKNLPKELSVSEGIKWALKALSQ